MRQFGKQMAQNLIKTALDVEEVRSLGIKDIDTDNLADVLMYRCIRILDFYEPDMIHEAPSARHQVLSLVKDKLSQL